LAVLFHSYHRLQNITFCQI